ncbi:MAG: caspase family protein [Myxococcota bacterium]
MLFVAAFASLLVGGDGYALIVSNNRSLDLARPDLRYADDDGAQWAQLFSETLGDDRVQLLTRFDPESQLLQPDWTSRAAPPTTEELTRAAADLKRRLAETPKDAVVYLVFAGHGDIDAGQGFLELEDARFTAQDLEALVADLDTDSVDEIHIILDSCNSYFMLNPRSASVERWEPPDDDHRNLLEKFPKAGAFISTSAEALTYEWSELQSGVFSYELRSGMRGAADVDGDGRVSYVELEAFVATANRAVINELYRPRVFAQAPAASTTGELIDLRDSNSLSLTLGFDEERRLTFRDGRGVRLMDVHKERSTALTLRLPRNSAIEIVETRVDGQRPSFVIRELPEQLRVSYVELDSRDTVLGDRNASKLFRTLFSAPFGTQALRRFTEEPKSEAPAFAVSLADAERLELNLRLLKQEIARENVTSAYRGLAYGSLPFMVSGITFAFDGAVNEDDAPARSDLLLLAAWPILGLVGSIELEEETDKLFTMYSGIDFTDVPHRSRRILDIERKYAELAADQAKERRWGARAKMILGATIGTVSALILASATLDEDLQGQVFGGTYLALSLVLAGEGIWERYYAQTPVEAMWELYRN